MEPHDEDNANIFSIIGVKFCSKHPDCWISYPGVFAPYVRDCPSCTHALVPAPSSPHTVAVTTPTMVSSVVALFSRQAGGAKAALADRISNTLHRLAVATKQYAGYDLPSPDMYHDFPFQIGEKYIHSKDCKACDRWVFFATFSRAELLRQKTANKQEEFCVFLLEQRDALLEVRKKFVDLESRSDKVQRIHSEFLRECAELKNPHADDFPEWVTFDTSCTQLTTKQAATMAAFEEYKKSEYPVLEIAEQVYKTQLALKARGLSVKADAMNDLLMYVPRYVRKCETFVTDVTLKLELYENHLNTVRVALKKLIANQAYEID